MTNDSMLYQYTEFVRQDTINCELIGECIGKTKKDIEQCTNPEQREVLMKRLSEQRGELKQMKAVLRHSKRFLNGIS